MEGNTADDELIPQPGIRPQNESAAELEARVKRFTDRVSAILRDVDAVCRESAASGIDINATADSLYAHGMGVQWDATELHP